MHISTDVAAGVFRAEARAAEEGPVDAGWIEKVEALSALCDEGESATHIAFLGTSMLARSVELNADLYAIKPKHAPDNPRAYSARSLSEKVLVPLCAELGVHLGVTGRQPLNNQPYFRMTRLGDGTPVRTRSRPAFEFMIRLVDELNRASTKEGRKALRAFIAVRRTFLPTYAVVAGSPLVDPITLATAIAKLVSDRSEGGRRAQAAVAGLFDVVAGVQRVESGRINDPSRHYPGDVCVRHASESVAEWEKAVEVRDKPVQAHDVQIFVTKCASMAVREAAVVMASPHQPQLDDLELAIWALGRGIGLTMFYGWPSFVEQALFWSALPKPDAAVTAARTIESRLVTLEASPDAVALWQRLAFGAERPLESLRNS